MRVDFARVVAADIGSNVTRRFAYTGGEGSRADEEQVIKTHNLT
jgi:hypothetical protein